MKLLGNSASMPNPKIFTTKPEIIHSGNFNPRNYDPVYLFVKNRLKDCLDLHTVLSDDVTSGSTPPYWFFKKKYDEEVIPYVKTSAILRDFINLNDLHFIHPDYHYKRLKRSITHPYNVIFSMTGKFMGKAALCPPQIKELNMTQNSVVLRCKSPEESAFICIYLNSTINQTQIRGLYSITKQKYLNQGNVRRLKVLEYSLAYKDDVKLYLQNLQASYDAVISIQNTIKKFDQILGFDERAFDLNVDFTMKLSELDKKIFTPVNYRKDFIEAIRKFKKGLDMRRLDVFEPKKGNEIGSKNYLSDGIPFIKTSDYTNFGVDYQPNHYCSTSIYEEMEQNLQRGDILFTKDGKIGQTAIIEESAKIVYSSGSIRLRASSENERYWIFLLLSSVYGRILFERWTVIASTMAHLRKDFFEDFRVPIIDEGIKSELVCELKTAFRKKKEAYEGIEASKERILALMHEIIKA